MKRFMFTCAAFGLVVGFVVVAEIIVRLITGYPTGFYRGEDIATWRNGVMVYKPDTEIVIHPKMFGGYRVRANNLGFRPTSPEQHIALEKDGRIRVLALGDSWTDSFNVPDEDTYPAQLQRDLDRRFPGRYEVINAAFGGGSIRKHLERLKAFSDLEPDIVVINFCANDLLQDLEWGDHAEDPLEKNPFSMRRGRLMWLRSVVSSHTAIGEWLTRARVEWTIRAHVAQYAQATSVEERLAIYRERMGSLHDLVYAPTLSDHFEERFRIYFAILDELRELSEARDIQLVLWSTAEYDEVHDPNCARTYVRFLEQFARRHRIPFVDPAAYFKESIREHPEIDLYGWAPVDFHPSREGYRLIAKALADALVELPVDVAHTQR